MDVGVGHSPCSDETTTPCLAVVIPCYNEADTLDEILRRVLARPEVAEVVVIDDASTDSSWERLKLWPLADARVRVVRQEQNRGKGAALRRGFAEVTAPVILVQDADLEYSPDDYSRLLAPLLAGEADVVYGSRFVRDRPRPPGSWWHWWGNRLLTWISNKASGLHLTDQATCYKMARRELVQHLDLREDGFGFCPEFTAKVARAGARVVEVPASYHPRTVAEGKKIRLRHGAEAVWCVLKYNFQSAR